MKSLEAVFGPNSALVEELFNQYKEDPSSVPNHWKQYFDEIEGETETKEAKETSVPTNGEPAVAKKAPEKKKEKEPVSKEAEVDVPKGATLEKIKGISEKIAENMDESLEVPTATSVRTLPMKMLIEDRTIINRHLLQRGDPKSSFTHYIAWAIIRALEEFPNMNNSYLRKKDDGAYKVKPGQVNLGLAIDVQNKDGSRNLLVPNIKGVDKMNFKEFLYAYQELIDKARNGNLQISDFQDTTITLTNPGMIGTVQSVPRLMKNQGTIIATGAIQYPAEYQSMSQEVLNQLGISKIMTVTSTYDHRVIQGAESGAFLKKMHTLLNGEEDFYDQIFSDLEIPYDPIPFGEDTYVGQLDGRGATLEDNKRAIAVMRLINMYRTRGHVLADLDPLSDEPGHSPELDFDYYGLTLWDLDREFYCAGLGGYEKAPLSVIIKLLRDTYCGKVGAEFMHLLDLDERKWLRERMESTTNTPELEKDDKKQILHKLNQAMAFEQFLHKKYIGHKRFSLEGADTLIPMMHFMLEKAGDFEIEKMFMGMAHRGRLNILVNILNKPYRKVFADFEGNLDPDSIQGSGDVKYHLGAKGAHKTLSGKDIDLELLPNPSHLESVNPVVEGSTRAMQDHHEKEDPDNRVVPVLIHGDAAFAGQGVVAETLNMSQLEAYKTGGTIHIIINNQIGFTTLPKDGRSTEYASDLAKMILAPIFHVNGDSPEAAVHSIQMALEYRQKFNKDVVIDLVCYRQHGHNEGDEPAFTQPGLYKEIEDHPSVRDIYTKELLRKGELSEDETEELFEEFDQLLQEAFEDAKNSSPLEVTDDMINRKETKQKDWAEFPDTTYEEEEIKDIALKLNTVPKDFDANPKLLKQLAKRAEIVEKNEIKIDWGFAEALAIGSLLKEGTTVRLTGQDAERGTFSHRHSILHGTETDQKYIPLNNLEEGQAKFYPYNSLLSEFACVGFEFGYSAAKLNALVIWEAQFGDFANGAQIPIDQFISASEAKWGQKSSLVMTLPHGYEGQGPEHSSGRLERFLQLCAQDNMQVTNLTTPAQYFHILRKQAMQENKKPLIIMSPKSLLRHPLATSSKDDLVNGRYKPFIPDQEISDKKEVKRLVICSGKVYYDLIKYRDENEIEDIAIARLEQFYPFPDKDVNSILKEYNHVGDIVWCQEEPKNMGAWTFVATRIMEELQDGQNLRYIGRQASASPAAGQMKIHLAEQERLVKNAMDS
ncbi:multifunctional oxoglutarate decarboxylase/oxoglutarate dehydrogenase thiamine pyrophosphate-binding subunit/dihydrolipoyllysine-residue succinyltransferase subunit [Aliifodinibius sp. S!AR15-10]|uniref:multifunctional oxoglutarate decarboxylase/oxoglutarate dehydrogenase thiamine pyrophosphate-binding subunit/dihydrolipoyllysine-residue succinyltransferase subunit n=1 Tax=Aliifodinibius sp. S!AR15-10 TaxID=2950437 RepID=UPI00285A3AA1|nr:multifunctional oxoglutarate decarboxylase/oxoglutarate dehydrogenase thiamine pyrophosphate-binding subunit/dihydrolipoyllysine-residue succinyltransferase subunit [Aliifodinibius sp. S!AR15-10]MDR8390548.1 multifunctional oxoglutarate decarboxylase/oxoglutarate dehydrogenase thiamine pyrophosphate-binding subunit/dihydrolipoyllysine-residue succinyltransferase subunit [Aliifodinibius sp. S!AR15-10]